MSRQIITLTPSRCLTSAGRGAWRPAHDQDRLTAALDRERAPGSLGRRLERALGGRHSGSPNCRSQPREGADEDGGGQDATWKPEVFTDMRALSFTICPFG
jgi:hypothetical protein